MKLVIRTGTTNTTVGKTKVVIMATRTLNFQHCRFKTTDSAKILQNLNIVSSPNQSQKGLSDSKPNPNPNTYPPNNPKKPLQYQHKREVQVPRPSILSSVTYGLQLERLKHEQKNDDYANNLTKDSKYEAHMNQLMGIIDIISSPTESLDQYSWLVNLSDSEFKRQVGKINDENKLIGLVERLYHQGELTARKLRIILFNKNMKNLKALPFDIHDLYKAQLTWSSQDYLELNIIMLKKYQRLHKPLDIVKNLKGNFEHYYLPEIKCKNLLLFYERIVWGFYFDYVKDLSGSFDEIHFINHLDDVYHSFNIWESCKTSYASVAKAILKTHDAVLNDIQTVYFNLCLNPITQHLIESDVQNSHSGRSELLQSLQSLSSSYKFHSFGELDEFSVETRAIYYRVVEELKKIVDQKMAPYILKDDSQGMVSQLNVVKANLTLLENSESHPIGNWSDKLLLLSRYIG